MLLPRVPALGRPIETSLRVLTSALGPEGCGLCRFYAGAPKDQTVGECRIGRPGMGAETREAIWPLVQCFAFCGEHRRRYVEETATWPAAAQSAA